MLILNRNAVSQSLSHAQCITIMDSAMRTVSDRDVEMPLRQFMAVPHTSGKLALMPGYMGRQGRGEEPVFGVKIVSKFPRASDNRLSSHVGAVILFDVEHGLPIAMLDGSELTAIRTSATSALASNVLARKNAETLTIMGCGEEAYHHMRSILSTRPIKRIIVWGRDYDRARIFVEAQTLPDHVTVLAEEEAEKAVHEADIICTVTSSTAPILKGAWLQPGVHVNLVGAAVRGSAEADIEVVQLSRFFVDYLPSALEQAGELLNAIEAGTVTEDHVRGEIGQVLNGVVEGRTSNNEITVYKSLGVSAQDLAAGLCAAANAERNGIGTRVEW